MMNIRKAKKFLILTFLIIYLLSFYMNQFYSLFDYLFFSKAFAKEIPVSQDKLVVIFVDSNIYNPIKDDIKRYATSRIQNRFSNTKALVLPIDVKDLKSWDIVKILENLYFNGEKDKSSKLIGAIFIGDVPLPVVNYEGFIYPSIYPYVDFVKKKYIFDPNTKFFIYSGISGGKPEIFHSIIRFKNVSDYKKFFDKLKYFSKHQNDFVSKKFRYDDFAALKGFFSEGNLPLYANKLIFAEAILRHYYTNLLFKLLRTNYDIKLISKFEEVQKNIKQYEKDSLSGINNYPQFKKIYNLYFDRANSFVEKWLKSGKEYLSGTINPKIPTKIIPQAVKNYFRNFVQLFSPSYINKIANNINSSGRWTYAFSGERNVDTVLSKVIVKDLLTPLQIEYFNNVLKKALNAQIEKNKYYMLYPVLTYYKIYKTNIHCGKYLDSQWENFYFGKYAGDITGAQDFTIYRGTYFNIDDPSKLTKFDISDKNLGSVGRTFGFQSRQVEANRGYDISLAKKDADLYKHNRCSPSETLQKWVIRYRGGASPLNIDYDYKSSTLKLKYFDYHYARNPSWNKNIGGWLFDIAGSKKVSSEIKQAYDWQALKFFSSVIQTKRAKNNGYFSNGFWCPIEENVTYCGKSSKNVAKYVDFFDLFYSGEKNYINIFVKGPTKTLSYKKNCFGLSCGTLEEKDYYYKLIDTRVYHVSPTLSEINSLKYFTEDRPIDDPQYISFLGIGGNTVKLIYPDLWQVNVFKKENNELVLLKPEEIEENIKKYLENLVEKYNNKLKEQLDKSKSYYEKYKAAFDFLGKVDKTATPNRQYPLLPKDYFIKLLGKDNIKIIAYDLYYHNLGWSRRLSFSNYLDYIKYLRDNVDINERIRFVLSGYLSDNISNTKVYKSIYPTKVWSGYEAGLIVSDGIDNIQLHKEPDIISKLENIKIRNTYRLNYGYKLNKHNNISRESKCGIPPSGAVPLLQWPSAFMCWLSSLPKSFKVTITDECSFTLGADSNCNNCFDGDKNEDIKDIENVYPKYNNSIKIQTLSGFFDKYFRLTYDKFKDILEKSKKQLKDINKLWSIYQVEGYSRYLAASNFANNVILSKFSNDKKELFKKFNNSLYIDIVPNNYSSIDNTGNYYISLKNTDPKDFNNLVIKVGAIGQSCVDFTEGIYINGTNICKDDYIFSLKDTNQVTLPLKWSTKKEGFNLIQVLICSNDLCVLKSKTFILTPGKLKTIKIDSIDDRIVKGGVLPIRVVAKDKYGNDVKSFIVPYRISINTGYLRQGGKLSKHFDILLLKIPTYFIDLSKTEDIDVGDTLTVSVKPTYNLFENIPSVEKKFKVVGAKISVYSGDKILKDSLIFKLPSTPNFSGSVIKLLIKVTDNSGKPLNVPVNVIQEGDLFDLSSKYLVTKNGKAVLFLIPTFKAGSGVLKFKVGTYYEKIIKIQVLPSDPIATDLKINSVLLKPGQITDVKVYIKDLYGNVIPYDDNLVVINTIGAIKVIKKKGNSLKIQALSGGGTVGYIYVYLKNKKLDEQIPSYKKIEIQQLNWPLKHLNIMYLSLFGTDWGNLRGYFSSYSGVANNIIQATSKKNLALTTYLVDPRKIKRVKYILKRDGSIECILNAGDCKNVNFYLSGGIIYLAIPGKFVFNVGNINDFKLVKFDKEKNLNTFKDNLILYIPGELDSFILSNEINSQKKQIIVNGKVIIDFNNSFIDKSVKFVYNGKYFDIFYQNKYIGKLKVYLNKSYSVKDLYKNIHIFDIRYGKIVGRDAGSTNANKAVYIYDENDSLSKHINFNDPNDFQNYSEGFKGFTNILNWAAGQIVGNATKYGSNEFVINFGDSFLKRVDKNPLVNSTNFDGSRGEQIFYSPNGDIVKVIVGDYNNDGLKDIIVAKKDGTLELLKNYGGNIQKFDDLGELMIIGDGIKNIYSADVNGDGYDDIIVWTKKNKLRVYYNLKGKFQIDGRLICLDIPDNDLKNVKQIFVKDMDLDGKVDIITNDINGTIKIFYGDSYVSKDLYTCDKERKSRLQEKVVKQFKLTLSTGDVYDDSLVHRKGLSDDVFKEKKGIGTIFDYNKLKNINFSDINKLKNTNVAQLFSSKSDILKNLGGKDSFSDVQKLYNKYLDKSLNLHQKFVDVPKEIGKPVYESGDNYTFVYAKIGVLDKDDPVVIYKTFEKVNSNSYVLKKGDLIKVTVHFINKTGTTLNLTYLENLNGPWQVSVNSGGVVDGFKVYNIGDKYIYSSNVDPYLFKVDNIILNPGQEGTISRFVRYYGYSPVNIDVGIFDKTKQLIKGKNFPQILIKPIDGCTKKVIVAVNNGKNGYRDYSFDLIDLSKVTKIYSKEHTSKVEAKIKEVENIVKKGDLNALKKYNINIEDTLDINLADGIDYGDFYSDEDDNEVEDWLENGIDINISLDIQALNSVVNTLQTIVSNLCHGFTLGGNGGNCGIAPPFNMAFFSPGIFNIFGCPIAWDWGLSIFWYPGTVWLPCTGVPCCTPLPVPYGTSIAPFIDPPNQFHPMPCPGIYPSNVRIYLSPTLTLGLGMAVCFGPYLMGLVAPVPPWGVIAGNCVVVGMPNILCPGGDDNNDGNDNSNGSTINQQEYLLDGLVCKKPIWGVNKRISPLNLITYNTSSSYISSQESNTIADFEIINGGEGFIANSSLIKVQRNYLGDTLQARQELLQNGIPFHLKIEGGTLEGLIKCIIKKWLDRQIAYIINALTNMTIYIYIPDFDNLKEGFNTLLDKIKNFDKLVSNIKGSFKNQIEGLKKDFKGTGDKIDWKKVLLPNKKVFKDLSDIVSNPFKQIEKYFEEVPLINIKSKPLVIKIPWLSEEEFKRLEFYLNSWLEENKKIFDEWKKVLYSAAGECSKLMQQCNELDGNKKQQCLQKYQDCNGKYKQYLNLFINIQQVFNRVKEDIDAINAWMNFPYQLYDYLHIIDKIINSIFCILDKFILAIIEWFHQNAARFEKWVDFIILLIAIIKTWQIIIQIFLDLKVTCGKCRIDNYDFYDCILALFCIDLPILPIPPFKLPDIYIDLTHINLGVDIVVPDIHFEPIKLPKIILPTLPYPPKINLSINLPLPPKIPYPPQLPNIHITIPTPEIKLPILLPPAPKIPPILAAIRVILELLRIILMIRCIIKNGIGLVAERNVKTRIEQLTQRTSFSFPFDFLSQLIPEFPFKGLYYDVRIDAFVNLKLNFSVVYDIAKSIADVINDFSDSIINEINKGAMRVNNISQDIQSSLEIPDVNINVDFQSYNGLKKLRNVMYYKVSTGDIAPDGYFKMMKAKVIADLKYLENNLPKNNLSPKIVAQIRNKIHEIEKVLSKDSKIKLNEEEINSAVNKAKDIIKKYKENIDNLAKIIKKEGWNGLQKLMVKNVLTDYTYRSRSITIYANVFDIDKDIKTFMKKAQHPLYSYLELNKKIVDGINDRLRQKSYIALKMSKSDYDNTKIYFSNLASNINKALKIFAYNGSYNKSLYKSVSTVTDSDLSKGLFDLYKLQDLSYYIHGLFVKGNDGLYHNVVYDLDFADTVRKNKNYALVDLNGDDKEDMILWDSKSVYIKRANQNGNIDVTKGTFFEDYYISPMIDKEFLNKMLLNKGYIKINDDFFKIRSDDLEVDEFKRVGTNYDNIGLKWSNIRNFDGYLIVGYDRVDSWEDKKYYYDKLYILVLPQDVDPAAVKLDYGVLNGFVYDLDKANKLILKKIKWDDTLSINLDLKPRKWRYVKILGLRYEKNILKVKTPLSNQVVLGRDVWSDNSLPVADIKLIKKKTGEVVDKGISLVGFINTYYKLLIKWKDNTLVTKSWITDLSGNVLKESTGNLVSLDIYSNSPKEYLWYLYALDINNNLQKVSVDISIKKPSLNIKDVKIDASKTYAQIISELSNNIDEGIVRFYRNRNGVWTLLTGQVVQGKEIKHISDFIVNYNSTLITGGLFSYNGDVVLKDVTGKKVGIISEDGKIDIYNSGYVLYVDVSKGIPLILVINKKTGKVVRDIFLKPTNLVKIDFKGDFALLDLDNSYYGIFNGGKCVLDKSINQCIMYVSPQGLIYIPKEYRLLWDNVDYNFTGGHIEYIFKFSSNVVNVYVNR